MTQFIVNILLISSALSYNVQRPIDYDYDYDSDNIQIPESFDARTNWPKCNSLIGSIADQSECGSCWAVASTSVMSDRRCIASNGTLQQPISAIDLMACCDTCESSDCDSGGSSLEAFQYWKSDGIVTGGNYDSNEGCKPYPFQPCEESENGDYYVPCDILQYYNIPICETKCTNNNLDYESDKTYGDSDVELFDNVEDIQKEILTNAPVLAIMEIYEDFLDTYESGVYSQKYVYEKSQSKHSVKIIGWGTDKTTNLPYWLVANSWGEDWGEEGLFKIVRGENSCGIEEEVMASKPKL